MNWLTITWSMSASAAALLGLMHLIMWLKDRQSSPYLLSAIMAASAAGNAFVDLHLLQTQSIEVYSALLQWQHVFIFGLLIAMVWVVYVRLGTARYWLAVTITVIWVAALVINFISPYSLVFESISGLKRITAFWGEDFTLAYGPNNPWKYLADSASLLIVIYTIDASIRCWRRGQPRRALIIGGSIVFFIVTAGVHTPLVDAGAISTPYMIGFAFLAIVMAMTFDLVSEAVNAGYYARQIVAEEARWNTVIENVHLAVISVDPEGLIGYANPFFGRLSGYADKDLIGRHASEVLTQDGGSSSTTGAQETELRRWRLACASGKSRTLALSSLRISKPDNGHGGILYIGADITAELKARNDLSTSRREMEHLGRVNMLGELVTALAHELNQPLAAILANSQAARRIIARQPQAVEEIEEILDDIIRDDKRAGKVIQYLRAMLAHEPIEQEAFSLVEAVHEVVFLLRSELNTQHVKLQVLAGQQLPDVNGGRIEIQQVVLNLVLNAIHAMTDTPPGKRVIVIDISRQEEAILVAIRDMGPGLPVDGRNNLFDAFFTTRASGLGMGLTICRRIIQAHAGRIRADNHPGGGAVFSFSLPLEEANGG